MGYYALYPLKNYVPFKLLCLVGVDSLSGLHTANLSLQTRVGKLKLVCVKDTTTVVKHVGKLLARIETRSICRQQFANVFADCFCAVHTHQLEFAKLEFANSSLPCEGCFRDQLPYLENPWTLLQEGVCLNII